MMKRMLVVFLALVLVLPSFCFAASAQENTAGGLAKTVSLRLSQQQGGLTDGNEGRAVSVSGDLQVTAESPIQTLYLLYYTDPMDFTVLCDEEPVPVEGKFLRQTVDLVDLFGVAKSEFTLHFDSSVSLLELYAYSEGALPPTVHTWKEPCEKADLCLFSTHADDEQLFFAGALPYYAGEKKLEVQVIYFTDHNLTPLRRHELLQGLWTVGVRAYPVISPFPDLYSTSINQAQNQLNSRGFPRERLVEFQVEMLRRFQPLVVLGHDPEGEYGHGQHRLNSSTLQEAVQRAGKETEFPHLADRYGVWEVPKVYLHLYGENPIVMDWDIPLEAFGGKTAFDVSKDGFECHKSQHYAWFYSWLNGPDKKQKAKDIASYSPCHYGLYRSMVGADEEKNDFFENLRTYAQQKADREKEEERKAWEEKQKMTQQFALTALQNLYRPADPVVPAPPEKTTDLKFLIPGAVCAALFPIALVVLGRSLGKRRRRK